MRMRALSGRCAELARVAHVVRARVPRGAALRVEGRRLHPRRERAAAARGRRLPSHLVGLRRTLPLALRHGPGGVVLVQVRTFAWSTDQFCVLGLS